MQALFKIKQSLLVLSLIFVLLVSNQTIAGSTAGSSHQLNEEGTRAGLIVTADALLVRPVGAALTAVGLTAFTLTLPVTAINNSIDSTAEAWVRKPARHTFSRCLGCTDPSESKR